MNKRRRKERMFKGQGGLCYLCGKLMSWDSVLEYPTVDHLIPRSLGGHDGTQNVALACLGCNQAKADSLMVTPVPEPDFTPCQGCLGPDRDPECLCT